ncbi:MAG: SdrD B-like domain-containing protein [Pirellulaceae bacterium]|nr:SdrD B-like domain-containing protein [Pirellulaceae bacterium]
MGLFNHLKRGRKARIDAAHAKRSIQRRCHFEKMEPRQLLDADPVIAGITYLEDDFGQDTTPDYFEVTFEGGAASTQMTQFVINGDQDLSGGLSQGDMFFDVDGAMPGAGQFHGFQFNTAGSIGISQEDILGVEVSADGLQMTVDVRDFHAGDRLAFTVDVDEVETLRNDKIASGVEFEGTLFDATFVDENYDFTPLDVTIQTTLSDGQSQTQSSGKFFDEYDLLLAEGEELSGGTLDLVRDNQEGNGNRTAGAIDAFELVPKPVTISGSVYHDENLNCEHDNNESGIGGVFITLQKLNLDTGVYESVAGTQTDGQGSYEFNADLGLTPGTYRIVESQPASFLDVGAVAGQVAGVNSGVVSDDAAGAPNVIADIDIPLGGTVAENYNFCEVKPASIQGNVWHDRNDDGVFDSGEEGIANVLIQVTRTGSGDVTGIDPFADTAPIFVRTDANGHYEVTSLPPGVYEITEINNYPEGSNPLVGFVDGKDAVGTIGGVQVGTLVNDGVKSIELRPDDHGVEYNFGELKPATINGYVTLATPEGECLDPLDPNHQGIEGVTVELYDIQGNLVASSLTNAEGYYEFDSLVPGSYSIVEVQPAGLLDGDEHVGQVNGIESGFSPVSDRFVGVELSSGDAGTMYNFCEHRPAAVQGTVWHDLNNDGMLDGNEPGIGGVTIQLFDAGGNLVSETITDTSGQYAFGGLYAGTYSIKEIQPTDYIDGKDSLGTVLGQNVGKSNNDEFEFVNLLEGTEGINYNFGELKPGSISGTVHADINGNCVFEPMNGDRPLEGVVLELLDGNGLVMESVTTDENGFYAFENLDPGEYSVREYTPQGYLDGGAMPGVINGVTVGQSASGQLNGITLQSGNQAVNYDFCEHVPAELSGTVWFDVNNDGIRQGEKEIGIAGVTIQLFNDSGELIASQKTDEAGFYQFTDLVAGTYSIREIQPADYVDGKESIGRVGGLVVGETTQSDEYTNVTVRGGEQGVDYDFGEIRLASIQGFVHLDPDGDCIFDASQGDAPLAGVTVQLLDQNGNVVGETTTDEQGSYQFDQLLPGAYSVREIQPADYFSAGQTVGSGGGTASENMLGDVVIDSGQNLVNYNFCEQEAAEIAGRVWEDGPAFQTADGLLPDGYRNLRDATYDPGIDTPISGVRMELWWYIDPVNGSTTPRPVTLSEVLGSDYTHLGENPDAQVWVQTGTDGTYRFGGLQAGNYIVLESQPAGFSDANDTPGTTTGFTFNTEFDAATQSLLLSTFSGEQLMDSVVNVRVNAGQASLMNNFSEVRAVPEEVGLPPTTPNPPTRIPTPVPPGSPLIPGLGLAGSQSSNFTAFVGGGRGIVAEALPVGDAYTWHLSVVNGGAPRGAESATAEPNWLQTSTLAEQDWNRYDMSAGTWTFATHDENGNYIVEEEDTFFGMIGGLPLSGDFDGDGSDELVVYKDGYWMIDLNGNGTWDIDDLMARLGDVDDRPVVGDWDGDGKSDIGIYGPAWEGDEMAIESEPGIPDPDNQAMTRPKNIPPLVVEAAGGARTMRLTSFGAARVDVIDHVFGYGDKEDTPVTGDWNGDGIRTIGMFSSGVWQLDLNGDGQLGTDDPEFRFGAEGDIPLVGDFDGDGVEEIAIFRDGSWVIDSNGNYQQDAADQVFEMGGRGDLPVVGDWDGDGIDEPAIYSAGAKQANINSQLK